MPLIQVTAQKGALSKSKQDALIKRLSDAVLKAEGAPLDSDSAQSLVWAQFTELPAGATYVGGKVSDEPPVLIFVTTPEGALNTTTREALAADIGTIVDDVVGPYEGRLNHWAHFNHVNDGCWAGMGQVLRLPFIQAAMHISAA